MGSRMKIGVINGMAKEGNIFAHVAEFGLDVCQLVNWDPTLWTEAWAKRVVRESRDTGVRVCALWAGWSGPKAWNFTEGPKTLGLVPPRYRKTRVAELKAAADFARKIKVPAIITHCGFIPENLTHPHYTGTVAAIREVATYCARRGLEFWFETGQETPVTLLRAIEDAGTKNLGINLDPANLVLYGRANPIDALDVFGAYVRNIHAKDGLYPTSGRFLGREVPVGKGKVQFPAFLQKLKEIGVRGEIISGREISGPQQARDIRKTVNDLRRWIGRLK